MIGVLFSVVALFSAHQNVDPAVAKFISQFSLAATEVDLRPDAKGNYLHRDQLQKTILGLRQTDEGTLRAGFALLDKNESLQRLVVGDLLLLLVYDVPDKLDNAAKARLHNVLIPNAGEAVDSPRWPWRKDLFGWSLEPFAIAQVAGDKSLVDRLREFKDYKRG